MTLRALDNRRRSWAAPVTDAAPRLCTEALGVTSGLSRSIRFRSMAFVQQLVDITAVKVVGDYRLRLTFEDGTVGEIDFATREWRGVFEPLRDPAYFARVRVDPESGTIAWPNGADMAPEPLYDAARNIIEPASSAS